MTHWLDLLPLAHWALATMILILAFTVRGMAGFGSGLIAIPLLSLMLPVTLVVPLMAALDQVAAAAHGIGRRQAIVWREIRYLLLPTLLGDLVGYFAFKGLESATLKTGLGVFVLSYGLYVLLGRNPIKPRSGFWAIPFGFGGGLISTVFGTGGPFYVIYLSLRGLDKTQFRPTIATIFLFEGSVRLFGYWLADALNAQVLILLAMALPIMAIALFAGERIHTSLTPKTFARAIAILLLMSGLALIVN